jgi:hypothetical protein
MLEDISENFFVDNPLGWRERSGGGCDPILPDVKKVVEKYGWDEFKFLSTKVLSSDWMAVTSLCRAATKPLLMCHLSDEAWCGHYDEATLEDFHSWVKTGKPCKWCLQGLLKSLAFVLYKQQKEKEKLDTGDFLMTGVCGGVDDDGVIQSRLFQKPKDRVNVKGKFTMKDVSGHQHRQDLIKPKRGKMDAERMIKVLSEMYTGGRENYDDDDKVTSYTEDGVTFTLEQLAEIRFLTNDLLQGTKYRDYVDEPSKYEKEDDDETQGFPTPREFTLPEGWKIIDVEGNTMWEEEETEELVYPCEDVGKVVRYEWVPSTNGSYKIQEV